MPWGIEAAPEVHQALLEVLMLKATTALPQPTEATAPQITLLKELEDLETTQQVQLPEPPEVVAQAVEAMGLPTVTVAEVLEEAADMQVAEAAVAVVQNLD
jgi:hypothetical protein